MQYVLLCYLDEARWESLPGEERAKIVHDESAFMQSIVRSGHYRANAKLKPTSATATVRLEGEVPLVGEGRAEAGPQLAAYFVVDCSNPAEAIAIAERIPLLHLGGSVQVRPVEPITRQ